MLMNLMILMIECCIGLLLYNWKSV